MEMNIETVWRMAFIPIQNGPIPEYFIREGKKMNGWNFFSSFGTYGLCVLMFLRREREFGIWWSVAFVSMDSNVLSLSCSLRKTVLDCRSIEVVHVTVLVYHVTFLFFQEIVKNKQCGYDVRKSNYVSKITFYVICSLVMLLDKKWISRIMFNSPQYADKWTSLLLIQDEGESTIYEIGCMKALEEWFERNYFTINLTIFVTIAVQVLWNLFQIQRFCISFVVLLFLWAVTCFTLNWCYVVQFTVATCMLLVLDVSLRKPSLSESWLHYYS